MKLVIVTLISFAVAVCLYAAVPPAAARCDPDRTKAGRIRYNAQLLVSNQGPEYKATRNGMHVPEMDSSQVVIVTADSLCRRAATLINAFRKRPDSASNLIAMVSFGDFYLAEDSTSTDRHWIVEFLMDKKLTTIQFTTGR